MWQRKKQAAIAALFGSATPRISATEATVFTVSPMIG
jgi:hypothetical protein